MTAELVTADLVERLQQAPLDAKAASEDVARQGGDAPSPSAVARD